MKHLFAALILIICVISVESQVTKGNWIIGGLGNFSVTNYKHFNNPEQEIAEINFDNNIGYFFINKFSTGLKHGLSYRKAYNNSIRTSDALYMTGPFARYYFLNGDKIVNFLSEGSIQFGISNGPLDKTRFSFLGGPVIFFNSAVGLEVLMGYSRTNYKNTTDTKSSFQMNVGFQFYLKKEAR
jgi:hypothetical protein